MNVKKITFFPSLLGDAREDRDTAEGIHVSTALFRLPAPMSPGSVERATQREAKESNDRSREERVRAKDRHEENPNKLLL